MRRLLLVLTFAIAAATAVQVVFQAADQAPANPANPSGKSGAAWRLPRTPDGRPDLHGTWNASDWALVPIQVKARARTQERTGDVPWYWYENGKTPDKRYMLIDPPGGVIPLRPEAEKSARIDEWTDENLLNDIQTASELDQWSRCITRGPLSLLPTSYNSGNVIVQTPGAIAVFTEMIHETRVIHLGGQHPPRSVALWQGDSRGHWEGDTLVVDITNFAEPPGKLLANIFKTGGAYSGPGETLHIVERFKRVDARTIDYRVTVEDPTIYTQPWTLGFPLTLEPSYDPYEYACHEGNHFVENVLTAARAREKRKVPAASKQAAPKK